MAQETQTARSMLERSRRNAPIDLEAEENKPVRAFLVGVSMRPSATGADFTVTSPVPANPAALLHSSAESPFSAVCSPTGADFATAAATTNASLATNVALAELKGLVDTLGMETVGTQILRNPRPHPRYGIGTGTAESVCAQASEAQADCIIFDFEISPTHQRNWEKLAGIPVFDRHEVILRIFAQRARTKEAVLQVELAKLAYSLPRLAHTYGDMARQRGGSYGAKGAGETKLELDRRGVQEKMHRRKKELEKVRKNRATNRKKRDKAALPSCAIVGYTNAGKSSLLNALTGADVLVENKLFATLDPTTKRLYLGENSAGTNTTNGIARTYNTDSVAQTQQPAPTVPAVLLTDTVGFIDGLPHNLVDAFKSTLEEAALADLLLIVLDSADPAVESQYKTVLQVLTEINADTVPSLILLNKTDLIPDDAHLSRLKQVFPDSIPISVKNKTGFTELKAAITENLRSSRETSNA